MTTCAICLNEVRETRGNGPIRCGHLFHAHCLDSWKARGKHTCPVCRKIFDGTNFRVQLVVHNLGNETSNTLTMETDFALEMLDLYFDVQNLLDLDSLLTDFGVSMSDLDPLVLDTE